MKISSEDWEKIIDSLDSSDFDGHTEFSTLTPEQKLLWLSDIARFLYWARNMKK